jgi:hypothetical protein
MPAEEEGGRAFPGRPLAGADRVAVREARSSFRIVRRFDSLEDEEQLLLQAWWSYLSNPSRRLVLALDGSVCAHVDDVLHFDRSLLDDLDAEELEEATGMDLQDVDVEEDVHTLARMDGADREAIDGAQQRVDDAREEQMAYLREQYLTQLDDAAFAMQAWLDEEKADWDAGGRGDDDDSHPPTERVALTLTLG